MEPKLSPQGPSVEVGGESLKHAPGNAEHAYVVDAKESAPERPESREVGPQTNADDVSLSNLPTPISAPSQPQQDIKHTQPADATSPVAANDDDLIEKEWVDKAKKIVEQNRNDPHSQEQAVSQLQADYLKKRYGKEIKIANN